MIVFKLNSAEATIDIDLAPPEANVTATCGGSALALASGAICSSGYVSLTASCTDANSGCKQLVVTLDGASVHNSTTNFTYTGSVNSDNADHTIVATSTDNVGNTATTTFPFAFPLSITCSDSPDPYVINKDVTYTATASKTGVTYSWDGGLGSGSTYTKSYSSANPTSKSVTVTASRTSPNETATATCYTNIYGELVVSCTPPTAPVFSGVSRNWNATAAGGNGSYTYTWSGTNMTSSSVGPTSNTTSTKSVTYPTVGSTTPVSKTATIQLTSANDTSTTVCPAVDVYDPPTVRCTYTSGSGTNLGITGFTEFTYKAWATGGNGSYVYNWNKATGANTDPNSPPPNNTDTYITTYNSTGSKTVTVSNTNLGVTTPVASCRFDSNGDGIADPPSAPPEGFPPGLPPVDQIRVFDPPQVLSCIGTPDPTVTGLTGTATWTAAAQGGSGSYASNWSGDEITPAPQPSSLYNPKQVTYTTPKSCKQATVSVYSLGEIATGTCTGAGGATGIDVYTALGVSCYPTPSPIIRGDPMTWVSQPSGGDLNGVGGPEVIYDYAWSFDGITSSAQNVTHTYRDEDTATSKGATINLSADVAIPGVSATCSSLIITPTLRPKLKTTGGDVYTNR
ncbi:MAG: hypothetical protein Q7S88_02990 [Candidatus Daviesbacteria bacterium]|nr:hypothetical protein [Candidatus Daviesbacteria bacterium]